MYDSIVELAKAKEDDRRFDDDELNGKWRGVLHS